MSKASAAEASGQAGFSLVEMLAALALVALIASFLSSTAGSGLRAWRAAKDLDREAQLHAVRGLLRDRLAAVAPLRTRDEDGNLRLEFAGTDQRLDFACMMPEGHVKAGRYKVSLYLVPEAGADAFPRQPIPLQRLICSRRPQASRPLAFPLFVLIRSIGIVDLER